MGRPSRRKHPSGSNCEPTSPMHQLKVSAGARRSPRRHVGGNRNCFEDLPTAPYIFLGFLQAFGSGATSRRAAAANRHSSLQAQSPSISPGYIQSQLEVSLLLRRSIRKFKTVLYSLSATEVRMVGPAPAYTGSCGLSQQDGCQFCDCHPRRQCAFPRDLLRGLAINVLAVILQTVRGTARGEVSLPRSNECLLNSLIPVLSGKY